VVVVPANLSVIAEVASDPRFPVQVEAKIISFCRLREAKFFFARRGIRTRMKRLPMEIRLFDAPDVKLFVPQRITDPRGSFSEIWVDCWFREKIADVTFVQDNLSVSTRKGTVRGLHFQKPPAAQGKLVRVLRGSIFDVAVDIRKGSPSYQQHVATRLDAAEGAQLWVPPGFLHGYCTLEDGTEVLYKVTSCYSPSHEAGVLWNDQDLGIRWPFVLDSIVLSDKDRRHPRLRDLPDYFNYQG
jgi:dTDP-4-dehydrorhamnose 3,5-epimerase